MAIPAIGSRWRSYKGTEWVYVGVSNRKRDDGIDFHTMRCVGKGARTRYEVGAEMVVDPVWFDRCGEEIQPGANPKRQ